MLPYTDIYTIMVFSGTFILVYTLMSRKQVKYSAMKPLPSLPVLPIIGSMPFMPDPKKTHLFFMQKAKLLGKVFGLRLASL